MTNVRTADQVAELYGRDRTTVFRWVKAGLFDPAPTIIPSPSGARDRVLFDVEAVAKQFEQEMTASKGRLLEAHREKLEKFRRG